MNLVIKKQGIFKRFLDARWAWDLIQGPIYNRLIFKAASKLYQRFIREINLPEHATILDIGSGPGFLTLLLARENPNLSVVGVDYSPTQVRAANRRRITNQIPNCSFRQGDALNLPFQNASFDIVISVASIKHWPEGKRGLQEIRRVLAPDGTAFIGEADKDATEEEIYRFASNFTAWYVWDPFIRWYLRRIVFGQSYTRKEAELTARAAGFSQVSVEKVSESPFFLMKLRK
ncbi:MAG: methyltransferase domain-containing protein [Candidatus Aminicenantes bacterium]|nr:methyltransferase domain-containing protein [Candidatus Aminicenantes bacterium]NIQ70571.1 methyltransferase domain-containing protein [Candidatus Aminicenantes bacterium]NIT26611.1 methyltransferase domain-containing protein [Candidatus Aminicenantes bacterium]